MTQSLAAAAGFAASTIVAWLGLAWLLRAHTNEQDVQFTSAAIFAAITLTAVYPVRVYATSRGARPLILVAAGVCHLTPQ